MSFDQDLWSSTESTLSPMTLQLRFANSSARPAMYPSSVVHTGVKSFGCENRIAQPSPIHSWKRIGPWVVSAVKSGASSPMRMDMNRLSLRVRRAGAKVPGDGAGLYSWPTRGSRRGGLPERREVPPDPRLEGPGLPPRGALDAVGDDVRLPGPHHREEVEERVDVLLRHPALQQAIAGRLGRDVDELHGLPDRGGDRRRVLGGG